MSNNVNLDRIAEVCQDAQRCTPSRWQERYLLDVPTMAEELKQLRQDVSALRNVVRRYADHDAHCSASGKPCSCGFAEEYGRLVRGHPVKYEVNPTA